MATFHLKSTHAPVRAYYDALERFGRGNFDNEGNLRSAFERLLEHCARRAEWTVIPEYKITRKGQHPIRVDAGLVDAFNLPRAYWEAKDSKDDLEEEIRKKFHDGYPRTNIIFQSPSRAILYQDGLIAFDGDITQPDNLVDVLRLLFEYSEPHIREWEDAVREFSTRIPEIATGAMKLIAAERKTNKAFVERFAAFAEVCRESINPDLKDDAVEKMLVQHMLTERIFRRIFDNPEFTRRNVIAIEIEKVIDSLTKKHFSRDQFLKPLDRFYKAIEEAASQTTTYSEKQAFLNVVYEKFFQSFDAKQADTHGIVYTPQPIVDFMVCSVDEILMREFGRSLSDDGVHILDPFVGTGTFITRIMQEIKTSRLPQKYRKELHCNEIMLLPYYIASMNIEHAYMDRTNEYEPFEGICLVDTFELAEPKQAGFEFMSEGNTERIRRQKRSPIFVVIGNPPYNVGQVSENDQNKNRKYQHMDARVRETYTRASTATLRSKLSDPYVKAFRWATDRVRSGGGVVAYVSNDSFVEQFAFDGMRKYLLEDFDVVYVLDLGGNVRKNPKLSGTTHNVFGIQVGVAVTLLIRKPDHQSGQKASLHYATVGAEWKKEQKYEQLNAWKQFEKVPWRALEPDSKNRWLTDPGDGTFQDYLPLIGPQKGKGGLFAAQSLGVSTNRDATVYGWTALESQSRAKRFADSYNSEVERYKLAGKPKRIDQFVDYSKLKWSRNLKRHLTNLDPAEYSADNVVPSLYRPFSKRFLYLADVFVDEPARFDGGVAISTASPVIAVCSSGEGKTFHALAAGNVPDLHLVGDSRCFPFLLQNDEGCYPNITDLALARFRTQYNIPSISRLEVFHYIYAVLHHPEYRERYSADLKREIPRIPFAPNFPQYAKIGAVLMKTHVEYENLPEYPLERTEIGKLNWKVDKKMTLSKDKTKLRYNDFLTFVGIPPTVFEYRLGNRSALEWILDQYRVVKDPRTGAITNDPNRKDDPEYIVRLIGQVVTVSLETVSLVRELQALPLLP